ncbi:hypothetical protein ABZ307_08310 [Streptomyces griseorubiginosus]|uniref:rhamnogalacturonan lyase family protein n=1 Tax=Streptomyces griseorubiginosus TaxID=67304 RepID=UPI0033A77661
MTDALRRPAFAKRPLKPRYRPRGRLTCGITTAAAPARPAEYGTGGGTRPLPESGVRRGNGTEVSPSRSGDIVGDRRGEAVRPPTDHRAVGTWSTPHQTRTRITTLFHDARYRTTPARQNSACDQPSRPGFVISDGMANPSSPVAYAP